MLNLEFVPHQSLQNRYRARVTISLTHDTRLYELYHIHLTGQLHTDLSEKRFLPKARVGHVNIDYKALSLVNSKQWSLYRELVTLPLPYG